MAIRSAEAPPAPSQRALLKGVQGFILFSILGIGLSLWWKRPANLPGLVSSVQWGYAALLLPLIAVDYVLGGLRYRLFFDGAELPRISLWECMRSNWANIFMGAATPFQTGGGPAQVYILWRSGARVADAVLISLVNFAATLIFFLLSTIAVALLLPHDFFGPNFTPVLRTGFGAVGGVAGLVLLALVAPRTVTALARGVFRAFPWRSRRDPPLRERALAALESGTQRFGDDFRGILKRRPWVLGASLLATVFLFFNKYLMGYVIARALGQDVPFGLFIGLQIIQLFLIYFAPTPGASGIAEISSVWLLGRTMDANTLLVYALAWRFATTVLGAFIGAGVLIRELREKRPP